MGEYKSRNVLVADDDKAMRAHFVKELEAQKVENVFEAEDGNEALSLFQQDKFDLVILDWGMPGKTGLEVLQEIRATPSDVPVIMVTATKKTRAYVLEAAEAGVTDYLFKPFEQNVLDEKLARYCRRKVDTSIYRCRNVMNSDVVSVKADATIDDAIALLLKHGISGLPVVDDQNHLLGIVTEHNLMESVTRPDLKTEPVSSVMTKGAITVDEDTIPLKVVKIMQENRIRRVPVVRDEKLVGLISRRDILRYMTENEEVLRAFLDELEALTAK